MPVKPVAEEKNILVDSGINYTETTETINNPGAGYTSTLWYTCKPGDTPVKNPSGNLVLMFINIGAFSSEFIAIIFLLFFKVITSFHLESFVNLVAQSK